MLDWKFVVTMFECWAIAMVLIGMTVVLFTLVIYIVAAISAWRGEGK